MPRFSGVYLYPLFLTASTVRIMMTGFLEGHQANGAFVAVGPPGKYHIRGPRETLALTAWV